MLLHKLKKTYFIFSNYQVQSLLRTLIIKNIRKKTVLVDKLAVHLVKWSSNKLAQYVNINSYTNIYVTIIL